MKEVSLSKHGRTRQATGTQIAETMNTSRRIVRNPSKGFLPVLAALFTFAAADSALALPVIPGAAGFGTSTPAGRGGRVYRVTNLNESGTGSLADCVSKTHPRVCIFEVSGTIRLTRDLVVSSGYLTIAGQTAPSPGIVLRGAALRIQTTDVLVQHLRVRTGDDPAGPAPDNRDALKIEGVAEHPARNVVIDHCSFAWAIDETAALWREWDNVSLLNNIFGEPLRESLHSSQGAPDSPGVGYGVLIGSANAGVTMVGNLLAHAVERNPLSRATRFVFVNNVVYNRANMDVDLQSESGRITSNSIVGNVFIRGGDYTRLMKPVNIRTSGTHALFNGSRVYLKDNRAIESSNDTWSVVSLEGTGGVTRGTLEALTPPTWPSGLVARSTVNNAVHDWVLQNAGARPIDRDSVDRRIVQSVRERNGRIINCVSADGSVRCARNAGGWPSIPLRSRPLSLPDNADRVGASGYTNLEVWLHAMSAGVEGRTIEGAPGRPSDLRVR
jgi:hypothetical protein